MNDDEEFDPSETPLVNRKLAAGRPQLHTRGRPPKHLDSPLVKQRASSSMNAVERNIMVGQQQRGVEANVSQMAEEKPLGRHKVLGLYVQSSTNEIVFYV